MHTLSMLVFRPQFAKLHPIVRCAAGHHRIQQKADTERLTAPEGVVARYFAGVGPTEGCITGGLEARVDDGTTERG